MPPPGPPAGAVPWWQHPLVIAVALLCCFPVGLALVWTSRWSQTTKLVVTGVVAVLVVLSGVSAALAPPPETAKIVAEGTTASTASTAPASTTTAAPATTAAPTAPPSPEQVAKDLAAGEITGEDEITASFDGQTLTIPYFRKTPWDEVQTFRGAFYDAQKVLPKVFGDGRLQAVSAVCLSQETNFSDPLGKTSRDPATVVCMTRDLFGQTNLGNSDPDRLYFYARGKAWPSDGIRFYVHPGVLKNIDFE